MDSYFQRAHNLPSELSRIIFSYSSLREDIQSVTLQSFPEPVLSGFNTVFFRNWYYIYDRIEQAGDNGTYYIFGNDNRIRAMYILR